MDSTLFSRFYSLKNVYYIIQCACVASLSLSLVFFAFASLLTLCFFSRLLRQKKNYTILKYVTDNLRFFGCAIALQFVLSIVWKHAFLFNGRRRCHCCFLNEIFCLLSMVSKRFLFKWISKMHFLPFKWFISYSFIYIRYLIMYHQLWQLTMTIIVYIAHKTLYRRNRKLLDGEH